MKIGEEVYIHGYIDEIRKDVIIIRNAGGYFGTSPSEIKALEQEPFINKACVSSRVCEHDKNKVLDKVKQAREEIKELPNMYERVDRLSVLRILDKLIGSEGVNDIRR